MKRGRKHAPQPKPAPAADPAPAIPPHIATLGIVKSVRPDGSYVCIHGQEMTECDECAPLALLADEEASGPATAGVEIAGTQEEGSGVFGALPPIDPAGIAPLVCDDLEVPEDLAVACAALGLASEHVLTHAIRGDGSVSIVTRGGARLSWPCTEEQRQAATALTDQQRDGLIRDGEGAILPRGKWLTTPHKF